MSLWKALPSRLPLRGGSGMQLAFRQTDREAVSTPVLASPPPWNAGLWAARKDRREHLLGLLCASVLLTITTTHPYFTEN